MSRRQYNQEQQPQKDEAYSNFVNSINSQITRKEYNKKFEYFMKFRGVASHHDMLLISVNDLESRTRDYIFHLRHDRKLAPATVSSSIAPITHFYEMHK